MNWRSDNAQAAGPELMVLLIFALAAWGVLAWVGRLNSTSQNVANTAQAAARAASIAADPERGRVAANRAVAASGLPTPCAGTPQVAMGWTPGDNGTWIGGTVTVTLRCTIANDEPFATAGRTVTVSDRQIVDPYVSAVATP
jgi:Flp pilus assembly protein TadG